MAQWIITEIRPQSPILWLLVTLVLTTALAVAWWRTGSPRVTWLWIALWILVPYVGLVLGGLSPRLMGLAYLDWPATLGLGTGLVFIMLALLAVVRIAVEWPDTTSSQGSIPSGETAEETGVPSGTTRAPLLRTNVYAWRTVIPILLLSGAEEFHWVFLRGALWESLLMAPSAPELPAYWAIWIAALWVLAETALRGPSFEQWLVQIAVLTATSILFLYTRNFWLCWMLHGAAVLILSFGRKQPFLPAQPEVAARPAEPPSPLAR